MTTLRWGAASDVGRLRSVNEDNVLAITPLFAVADGMGGHAGGEVASEVALTTLHDRFNGVESHTTESFVQAVRDANVAIYDRALLNANLRGMGTTLTGVALVDHDGEERLAVVNVGDSRTYVVQDGILQQITRDHTYVEDLVAAGEITAEEARYHPQRHIVTRALGIDPDVQIDAWEAAPAPGDRYLICSDGLFNEIDDAQIAAVLTGTADPQAAADALVRLANDAGGRDNITVIVLDIEGDSPLDDHSAPPTVPTAVAVEAADAASSEAADDTETPAAGTDVDEPGDSTPSRPPARLHEPEPYTVLAAQAASEVVEPPVGLVSPDGAPPVGGWLDTEEASTEAVPVPPPTSPPEPTAATPRRRRLTWRAVLFVVAILAVLAIAIGGIVYYGRSGYYVGFAGDQVAVFKGQEGGVLWVDPTLEATYPLHRQDLSPAWQQNLDRTITFTSRAAADAWYDTLTSNPDAVVALTTPTTLPSTTVATTAAPAPDATAATTVISGP